MSTKKRTISLNVHEKYACSEKQIMLAKYAENKKKKTLSKGRICRCSLNWITNMNTNTEHEHEHEPNTPMEPNTGQTEPNTFPNRFSVF